MESERRGQFPKMNNDEPKRCFLKSQSSPRKGKKRKKKPEGVNPREPLKASKLADARIKRKTNPQIHQKRREIRGQTKYMMFSIDPLKSMGRCVQRGNWLQLLRTLEGGGRDHLGKKGGVKKHENEGGSFRMQKGYLLFFPSKIWKPARQKEGQWEDH